MQNIIQYGLIFIVLAVLALAILKAKKNGNYCVIQIDPDYVPAELERKQVFGVTFEQGHNFLKIDEKSALSNIVNYEVNKSRFMVELKDVSKADKEAIQKLGAQGIVEIDNQLKIILGDNAKQIKNYINELGEQK